MRLPLQHVYLDMQEQFSQQDACLVLCCEEEKSCPLGSCGLSPAGVRRRQRCHKLLDATA